MPTHWTAVRSHQALIVAALLVAATPMRAQSVSDRAARADPLDPRAPVPALTYQSPLAGYRALGDNKAVPWKDANETVNRIGGWKAYAREAQQSDAPGPAPGQGGHKAH
jgi:hypothetical protein